MDNDALMKMFLNMMETMSDDELNVALNKAKSLLSSSDYEKLLHIVSEKRSGKK